MGRKKQNIDISSLELLLDTMCNTFGGVVFIAIMLCLMTKAGGLASVPQEAIQNLPQDDITAVEAAAEAATLEHRIEMLEDLLAQYPAVPDGNVKVGTGDKAAAESPADMQERIRNLRNRLTEQEKALREAKDKAAATGREAEKARRDAEKAKQEQTAAAKGEPRSFRTPRLHLVENKITVLLGLRGKRFYAIYDVSARSDTRRPYDTADVAVITGTDGPPPSTYIDLRREGGQPLAAARAPGGKLQAALSHLDPRREYVSFLVYTDSFAEFNEVKRLFVERGFDYDWTPAIGTDPVKVIDTPEAHVQ